MYFLLFLFIDDQEFTCPQSTKVTLSAGRYQVYCYGAQGGRSYRQGNLQAFGGKGAYTTGVIQITGSGTAFYLNVGGMGGYESALGPNSGGYNGGGKSGRDIQDPNGGSDGPGGGDDASGGGGGATDIRIYNNQLGNRIMVAAGGSGAAFRCNGAPGGDYKGYYPSTESCDVYVQSEEVSETKGNENGVGSNGADFHCTPGSGGGGGYRGGIARRDLSCNENYIEVSVSGSSYISGHPEFKANPLLSFNETIMHNGNYENFGNNGNGILRIRAIYECPSDCSDCSS